MRRDHIMGVSVSINVGVSVSISLTASKFGMLQRVWQSWLLAFVTALLISISITITASPSVFIHLSLQVILHRLPSYHAGSQLSDRVGPVVATPARNHKVRGSNPKSGAGGHQLVNRCALRSTNVASRSCKCYGYFSSKVE